VSADTERTIYNNDDNDNRGNKRREEKSESTLPGEGGEVELLARPQAAVGRDSGDRCTIEE